MKLTLRVVLAGAERGCRRIGIKWCWVWRKWRRSGSTGLMWNRKGSGASLRVHLELEHCRSGPTAWRCLGPSVTAL